ncbi:hypothetical protein EMIT0232MI5_160094 [Pseudomonas sp. IT-232MI5]
MPGLPCGRFWFTDLKKDQKIAACGSSYEEVCVSRAAMSLTLSYKTSLRFELYRDGAR